jgi:transposase-like protein
MARAKIKRKGVDWKELLREERDFLKAAIQDIVQEVLEAEMDEAVGARKSERTADRTSYRSGYYSRGLVTRVGKLEMEVPQDRKGHFSTEVFERYQRSEKALVSSLAEMYVQGVSTRKVKTITEELCGHAFSASSISRINQSLDEELKKFATRKLEEEYPYLILDARYEKVREDGVIRSQAVMIAIGINWDGRRTILAVAGGPGEHDQLAGLCPGLERTRLVWRGLRRHRRSCRFEEGDRGVTARSDLATVLRPFSQKCVGLFAAQSRR